MCFKTLESTSSCWSYNSHYNQKACAVWNRPHTEPSLHQNKQIAKTVVDPAASDSISPYIRGQSSWWLTAPCAHHSQGLLHKCTLQEGKLQLALYKQLCRFLTNLRGGGEGWGFLGFLFPLKHFSKGFLIDSIPGMIPSEPDLAATYFKSCIVISAIQTGIWPSGQSICLSCRDLCLNPDHVCFSTKLFIMPFGINCDVNNSIQLVLRKVQSKEPS